MELGRAQQGESGGGKEPALGSGGEGRGSEQQVEITQLT